MKNHMKKLTKITDIHSYSKKINDGSSILDAKWFSASAWDAHKRTRIQGIEADLRTEVSYWPPFLTGRIKPINYMIDYEAKILDLIDFLPF